jgi:hypothetical protein
MNPAGPGGTAAGIDRGGNNQGLCQVAADGLQCRPINGFSHDLRHSRVIADPEG